ncbi:hypothetical protein EJ04DRAFT_429430 [Polyplosphaeria fusca]|uniref:MARVEL domain-containing protein n=1 Tax=Polyplosphaeria fusca TaxID=682080 RepID=A0A9P4R7U0_9PLEO|nr:hypothetical protein EJ04DRAFT_429430 [Polyplosphaeria fusca]
MENPHIQQLDDIDHIKAIQKQDKALKARIRRLRFVSRTFACLVSIAVFVPITLTLHKFLTTKDVFNDVTRPDGQTVSRTAWAKDSKTWPTYMYFAVAALAVILNFAILISYWCGGVEKANKAATVATTFSWITLVGNLVVWSVAAALYRKEKKTTDLWGWTCSPAARAIQKEFSKEVDFDKFCNVQSASWYAGLGQIVLAVLTIITYVFVLRRRKTKRVAHRQSQWNPARH